MQVNKPAAFAALDAYADAGPTLVKKLKEAGYKTVEDARVLVVEWAADRTKCPLIKSEHHLSKTPYVLDKTHAKYETARKAVLRVLVALNGKSEGVKQVSRKSEPKPAVSRAHKAAAMTFLASFEGKTLAAQIKAAKAVLAAL